MAKKQKKASSQSIPIRVTRAKTLVGPKSDASSEKPLTLDITPKETAQPTEMGEDAVEQKPAKPVKLSKEALDELLGSETGEKTDMTKLTKGNKTRRIIFRIVGILLVLFVVALAGFFFFSSRTKKFGQQIMLSIDMPQEVSSGDVITLQVKFQNNESVILNDAELAMHFPDGFLLQSSTPSNTAPNAWTLGTVKANAGGIIEIRGQLVGDVGTVKTFAGTLSYRPDNFNYTFEQDASVLTTITNSTITLSVDAPLRIVPEKEFAMKITYKNIADKKIPKLQLVLDAPDEFTSSKVAPEAKDFVWKLDDVAAGSEGTVTVNGKLSGEVGVQKQFTIRAGYLDTNGTFTPQTQQTFLVLLIKAGLTLSVKADPEGDAASAQFGKSIAYEVGYTNDGDVPLTNVTLTLQLNDETSSGKDVTLIDWNTITTLDKAKLQDKAIVWESKNVSALASLKPGDSGKFQVTVPLVSVAPVAAEGDSQFHIMSQLVASQTSKDSSTSSDAMTTKSEIVETLIASQVTLETDARYYSDTLQKLGSGPLPPTVGQETQYVIFWRLSNSSNDIKDVSVTSTLPSEVTWIGNAKVSAGNAISFNPQTREISWSINRIPAGSGVLFPKLEASFTISVTPTASQAGQFLVLTNSAALSATDTYVSAPVQLVSQSLTSDLSSDPQGRGKGIVVAE